MNKNPLDYVTQKDLTELGLSPDEIATSYQPSKGGVYHARGAEGEGKTLWLAHFYRYLIDNTSFTPYDAVGNTTFKGKYGQGFTVLKGDKLRQYLWDLIHIPYTNKIVIISEADSEFPARSFTDKEQTEIATRLWHTAKLGNYILLDSHIGNSVDLIMHLASHFYIYPRKPNFETNSMQFMIANKLDMTFSVWTAYDIIKTMLIYNRCELTEETEAEQAKIRPSLAKKQKEGERLDVKKLRDFKIDFEKELSIKRVSQ